MREHSLETQEIAMSLGEDFVGLRRIRPGLVIWNWCVTGVRRKGDGKLKRKIPRRNEVGTEIVIVPLPNSPQEKISNNFFPTGVESSVLIFILKGTTEKSLIALRIGRS